MRIRWANWIRSALIAVFILVVYFIFTQHKTPDDSNNNLHQQGHPPPAANDVQVQVLNNRDKSGKDNPNFAVQPIVNNKVDDAAGAPDEFVQMPADSGDTVDWHDHKAIAKEQLRKGPGEQGIAYQLPPGTDKNKVEELYRANGYNGYLSDQLSLYRAVKDLRHPACKTQKYHRKLPTAAIVVPFHNEHFSTLLRTVVSCRHRAPRELLKEIILVDDNSSKPELKAPLDDYLKKHFDNVKVVRAGKREGLIRARILGAKHVTADTFIVLDSHCECGLNWLPPLLDPIAENWRTAVCPFVDIVDFDNYEIRPQDEGARGSWDWQFYYKRLPLLEEDKKYPSRPFASPVMAGGLFAINTKFFWEVGGYDPGLDIWGGEQYELSFKVWQCHGRMVDAPCSRIGHIYRKFAPFPNPGLGDFLGRNFKRVAEVWMDEYKEYLYDRKKDYWAGVKTGDISVQKALREKLKCHSFDWFMKNVAFDQPKHYPFREPPHAAEGEIRNVGANLCVDAKFRGEHANIIVDKCILKDGGQGEQKMVLTYRKDIRPYKKDICFDVPQNAARAPVVLFGCHGFQGNQHWVFDIESGHIRHPTTMKCLDTDAGTKNLFVSECSNDSLTQKWKWQSYNATLVKRDASGNSGDLRMS